jgi:capsular polysaccharide biosynthesis protein
MNGLPYTGSFDDRGVIDTLIVVKKRKLLSFTAFAGVSFFSLGVLTAVTPKYDASAILMVGNEKGDHNVDTQHKNALNSLALIADSQEVVSGAITAFGLPRLIGREKGEEQSAALSWPTVRAEAIAWLTDHAGRLTGQANAETSVTEPLGANERSASAGATVADHQLKRAVSRVSKALTVHVEPNSDLVTITFRDADAEVAAEFANAIAMEAINKRLSVLDQSEAANFYQAQTRRFED